MQVEVFLAHLSMGELSLYASARGLTENPEYAYRFPTKALAKEALKKYRTKASEANGVLYISRYELVYVDAEEVYAPQEKEGC